MSQPWPYPGARWWKFDFHTHTPASKDTGAWRAAIGTPNELTPKTWLLKYMAAGIDCVAVTDHNTGEWIDKLKAAYAEMKHEADAGTPPPGFRELYLFPGVEVSVQGGLHLLAIFDPSATSQTISDLLARVDYEGTRGDSDGVTRIGAAQVVERILAAGGLAIPAHVEGDKGLLQVEPGTRKCLMDTTTVKQVLQEPGLLALEWTASTSPVPMVLDELKLRLSSVVGSDCHSFQGSAVPGSRYTWIKMAKPSLEGLRLALLDGQEVSVRRSDQSNGFSPFNTPEHFIESIEIQNARYMGRGRAAAYLPLNPYFNALIGGRGTGKSTIVHALRLAYRRESELSRASEAGQTFNKFSVIAKTRNDDGGLLTDTVISVRVHRDGSTYRLMWRQDGQGHAVEEWDTTTSGFKPSGSQAINEQRFPVRLFSQGQIAALASDSQQALLKVIDDAADTRTQKKAFEEAKSAFLASRAQMRELEGKLLGRESVTLSLQDIQRKLARFEGADHTVVLKNYQHTSQQNLELERHFEASAELAARLKKVATDLQPEDLQEGLFDPQEDGPVLALFQTLKAAIDKARQDIENTASTLQARGQALKGELEASAWFVRIGSAKTAYDQLKANLQQQGVNDPNEYGRLVQEKQRLETELKRLEALQKQHTDLREKAMSQLEQVQTMRRTISTQRNAFLQATLRDNPFVRIELIPYSRDIQGIERSLREVLGVADSKYADDLYQEQDGSPPKGLIADLMLAIDLVEKPGEWDTPNFEQSLMAQKKRLSQACRGKAEFGGWFNKFLKAESDKRPEFMDHILCWFPDDGLQVEYSRKGDGRDFQSIGQASAGQRAAAMLAFLLAHGTEPLVLDQPEDDLDNHLIYGLVVQQIRSNKLRRQLIIVTHNPNIVVNGDAELIHVLDFNNQCHVKQVGSLQEQIMRQEVCQVMEGGEEAFERRYQRLGREV
ncbi:chromosome segregation protein SMC [Pseudomonas aeruginosa]|uniref:TrlF family AAA-like ATPase n=1 Tax=Pseudomonas aeruginosa TaxID=287 RepID=UPI00168AB9D8|nr:chromosome segregation protein SMC [Pseudomonas aeruginosa]MBD3154717.1 chromosome segregation protein SMC [Pseudomonas aeruginosa]MCM8577255.1 chromosome segregation protein SMC [Pseudomonas aeruginosa]HDV4112533.1 chromosome segregation protein SMC [Pseudomonas aeruginosa]HDV4166984.1 chromosome segregation protein SMC [Pseudomonas aeruginosa]HDV4180123.1 chromosome segregation protein SMC [Pseudomonas aeruginosa]